MSGEAREMTLAERVEKLEQAVFELHQDQRMHRDDIDSHHTRICRVENEVGLLPKDEVARKAL